jgi:peroxiredoxin Q/BCP
MEAYRDQYATLFNNGKDVVVIAISVDPDTALASWARDLDTPILLASDPGGTVGKRYGAFNTKHNLDDRSLFVIAPNGKVVYRAQPFRELVADSYTELAAVIDKLAPPAAGEGR